MIKSKTAPWVLGAVVLSVAIVALAWFFVISPVLEETAQAREQIDDQSARNDLLVVQNAQLKKQFENIEEYRDQLAEYRVGVPDAVQQREFTLELAGLSAATDAFIVEIAFESSTLITEDASGISSVDLEALRGDASSDEDSGDDASEDAVTTVPPTTENRAAPNGLYGIPVRITVLGAPEATTAFLSMLQQETDRLFFVADVDVIGQDESGASGGRPATRQGDAELTINGYLYVLDEEAAGPSADVQDGGLVPDDGSTAGDEPPV